MQGSQPNPVLVHAHRGPIVESFHRGVICIVNDKKETIFSVGDTQQICYPRSAMKFFQQLPFLAAGGQEQFGLTQEEIALLCGSHNGEDFHVKTVESILSKGGFTESDLLCGPQFPTHKKDQELLIKNGLKPRKIQNNCSGKHAGFLLYAKLLGVDHTDYISPLHPVQQEITKICAQFYETKVDDQNTGIDGCSAPIFAFTVEKQAIAYAKLVNPTGFPEDIQKACKTVVDAVINYPLMIAGTKRYCTELMQICGNSIVGKTGADGVYCLAIPEKKWGITIKIDDGKMGPQYNVAQALLQENNLIGKDEIEGLVQYVTNENKNFGGMKFGKTCMNPAISLKIKG